MTPKKRKNQPLIVTRKRRNSKHDVPCSLDCLLYPRGKRNHTPKNFFGRMLAFIGIDLQTRPKVGADKRWWVQPAGRRSSQVGRHWECPRPNMFFEDSQQSPDGAAAVG